MKYADYQSSIENDVTSLIADLACQPVLFFGAGISRRYFGAPTWNELLKALADQCPLIDKEFAYYAQSFNSWPRLGSEFANYYREWAWASGRNRFDGSLFDASTPRDAYIKASISAILASMTPAADEQIDSKFGPEIDAMRLIKPHAIITTNYDTFLELVFPDHEPVIGQEALHGVPFSVGEIFKIHGSVTKPTSLVLTAEDYAEFSAKKKFIAAKLLTLFNEHPLLIAGYGAGDKNVQAILSDIDEALALPGSLIPNIYFLEWDAEAESRPDLPREKLIQIADNRSVRVKLIVASDFRWVFRAFKSPDSLSGLSPKTMRAILARSYELVRSDIPRRTVKVNFEFLERKLENSEEFAQLFGITTVSEPSMTTAQYPYTATELGRKLGGSSWHTAHKLMEQVENETGFEIRKSDNKYHQRLKLNKSTFGKFSDAAVDLLQRVQKEGRCLAEWIEKPGKKETLFPELDEQEKK